jgi:ribosomal protein S18 acetylase RimI-like enzyme
VWLVAVQVVWVDPSLRGKGVGPAMVRRLVADLAARDAAEGAATG